MAALASDAAEMLGHPVNPPDRHSAEYARQFLARLRLSIAATLTNTTAGIDARDAGALLTRIHAAETDIAAAEAAAGTDTLQLTAQAIARLRGARGVDDLLSRAAEALGVMGFDRALVSTVEGVQWHLHTMFITGDKKWADDIVAAGRASAPTLDGQLVEAEIVAHARPGLVFDVQRNPRVVRPIVEITHCSSYGVAPVVVNGSVAGLVHGDYYFQQREVDAAARAMLAVFAEALGNALAGARLLDGLTALRTGLDQLSGGLPSGQAMPATMLSSREIEVVDLLAAGKANRQIARELAISEATVKTHITHILRKLGAANRAEAVAYWLRRSTAR
ncbi:response regulator transcription factor [Nocardia cyriacigeorgica]|uniref:response regulator transcription factor n=1 Tax=Nocardia cyriacigeorgica TaxID=135487 RepID=UPI002456FD5B|nr:response regulator transcription factor [Nocardia cyriacigeorgica]